MKSKNIFIHIPKTGGTTLNCVISKSQWQTEPDFNYRHIIYETKRSNSADIFNPLKNEEYIDYEIFTMLRNPVDRLISEYYFIKDRPEFMSLLKPLPKNLLEYANHRQTRNYMVGFMLGKRMYDEDLVTESDLELVINTIKSLNIRVGIFEYYEKSMRYFSSITGIKWPKSIDIKRKTLNRPKIEEVSESIKSAIIKNNHFDMQLYERCKQSFEQIEMPENRNKINFVGNEYDYIMKYTQRFNLLQIALSNTIFIESNQLFFSELNKYLHGKLKASDGKSYVIIWNDCFLKSISETYPDTELVNNLNEIDINLDPLEKVKKYCKLLDKSLAGKSKYKKAMIFKPSNVNMKLKVKKGLFSFLK